MLSLLLLTIISCYNNKVDSICQVKQINLACEAPADRDKIIRDMVREASTKKLLELFNSLPLNVEDSRRQLAHTAIRGNIVRRTVDAQWKKGLLFLQKNGIDVFASRSLRTYLGFYTIINYLSSGDNIKYL